MPVWSTDARLQRGISSAEEADLTSTLTTLIADASAICQTDLDPFYWAFPSVTATITTPLYIQDLVALKAISLARMELGKISELNPENNPEAPSYREKYEALIDDLRNNRAMIPQETVTAEPLLFGTSPYDSNEHPLVPGALVVTTWTSAGLDGFEVIPESARVSGYEYGIDFIVRFNEHNRSWVFVRYSGSIVDANTVTYKISYRKAREKGKTPRNDSTELCLA